jgi:hypothetical protein
MSKTIKSMMKHNPNIDIVIHGSIYMDKTPALMIRSHTGEPIATATININKKYELPDMIVAIKDYRENEGVLDTLITGDIIKLIGTSLTISQFVDVPLATIIDSSILDEIYAAKERVA